MGHTDLNGDVLVVYREWDLEADKVRYVRQDLIFTQREQPKMNFKHDICYYGAVGADSFKTAFVLGVKATLWGNVLSVIKDIYSSIVITRLKEVPLKKGM